MKIKLKTMKKQTKQKYIDAKLSSPCITEKQLAPAIVKNLSTFQAIRVIKQKLNPSQLKRFESSCFGKLFHISTNVKFSGQLIHHLLSRKVDHPNEDEMWFLIGDKHARFSKDEFALITGLNCRRNYPHPHGTTTTTTTQSSRLVDKYFHGQAVIRTSCLKQRFLSCEDDEDVFRLSLVYFLVALLLSRDWKISIDKAWLSLVDDLGAFDKFPWGDLCYERTLLSLKKKAGSVKIREYALSGFSYSLQIWAYEVIPLLGSKFAKKSDKNLIPRILCWESTKTATFDKLHENVFSVKNLRVLKTLSATELEREQDYMKTIAESSFKPKYDDFNSHHDTERYGDSSESKRIAFMKTMGVKKQKKHTKQKGVDAKSSQFSRHYIKNLSTLDAIRVIKRKLNHSQLARFKASCFGKLFGMSTEIKFSSHIVKHLLSRHVDHPSEDETWFLIGDKRARFSLYEFALITGLNCGPNYPSRTELEGKFQSTRLVDKYFGGRKLIYTRCLKEQFICCEDEEDSYRLSLVYFLQALLLARDDKASIDKRWLFLVDNLESFDEFPWGTLCYERTLLSLKKTARIKFEENGSINDMVKPKKKQCTLHGFPFAFQIWAYEAIPHLGSNFAEKNTNSNSIPRILCWEHTRFPSFKELHNVLCIKNLRVLKTLRATEVEREQDYMKAITLKESDSDSHEATNYGDSAESMELGEEYDDDRDDDHDHNDRDYDCDHDDCDHDHENLSEVPNDISSGRGKGKRKRRTKTSNVPFLFTDFSKKKKLVSGMNVDLNPNDIIDSMEVNQPLENSNNCNLQTSVQECLGRNNAFMCNGDEGAQHSNSSSIDLDAFVCGGSLYNKPLPRHILEHLDAILQHELDLDFSCDDRQSTISGVIKG